MTRRPWYQDEDSMPAPHPSVPTGKISAEKLEDRYIKSQGRYLVFAIENDYRVFDEGKYLGTIPAGTRGIITVPAGEVTSRTVEFNIPRGVIINPFKKHNRIVLPISLFRHVGYIDEL